MRYLFGALAALAIASAVSGCASDGEEKPVTEDIYQGPIPEKIDLRLERRDTAALPADALVKFQFINRGKDPSKNFRWILYEDGSLFAAHHSGDTSDWQVPFDTALPKTPSAQLNPAKVSDIRERLLEADFLSQPAYQANEMVKDGAFYIITARIQGQVHEVIYVAHRPPLVDFLMAITSSADVGHARESSNPLKRIAFWR